MCGMGTADSGARDDDLTLRASTKYGFFVLDLQALSGVGPFKDKDGSHFRYSRAVAALVGSFEVQKSLRYDNRANFTPAWGVFQEIDGRLAARGAHANSKGECK